MPEVRLIPNRSRTLPFTGPLPQREHRKIALSVEGEAAALTAAAPKGMKVDMRNILLTQEQKDTLSGAWLTAGLRSEDEGGISFQSLMEGVS